MKVSERERKREEPWSIHHDSVARNEKRGLKAWGVLEWSAHWSLFCLLYGGINNGHLKRESRAHTHIHNICTSKSQDEREGMMEGQREREYERGKKRGLSPPPKP